MKKRIGGLVDINKIIDTERWMITGGFDTEVKRRHNASLDYIGAKLKELMFPEVRKIWIDEEGHIRIDFTGDWHIAMSDRLISEMFAYATDPLHKRIDELENKLKNAEELKKDAIGIAELEIKKKLKLKEENEELPNPPKTEANDA